MQVDEELVPHRPAYRTAANIRKSQGTFASYLATEPSDVQHMKTVPFTH